MTTSISQWLSDTITKIENAVVTTEADIQIWIAQIQSGLGVVETDLAAGLKWVASNAPTIVADLEAALALAQAIPGLQIPAGVATAITASAAALTSVAQTVNAGQTSGQTLVAAYKAVVDAKGAQAGVLATITAAPTPAVPAVTPAA